MSDPVVQSDVAQRQALREAEVKRFLKTGPPVRKDSQGYKAEQKRLMSVVAEPLRKRAKVRKSLAMLLFKQLAETKAEPVHFVCGCGFATSFCKRNLKASRTPGVEP